MPYRAAAVLKDVLVTRGLHHHSHCCTLTAAAEYGTERAENSPSYSCEKIAANAVNVLLTAWEAIKGISGKTGGMPSNIQKPINESYEADGCYLQEKSIITFEQSVTTKRHQETAGIMLISKTNASSSLNVPRYIKTFVLN